MMKKAALILLIFSCFYGCQPEPKDKPKVNQEDIITRGIEPRAPVDNHELMDSLKVRAVLYGDAIAYNELFQDYFIENRDDDILYISMIMADKYNIPSAHHHIYLIWKGIGNDTGMGGLSKKIKDFALYHLLKSHELGYQDAIYEIEEVFGEGKPIPKSSYFMQEYAKE